MTGLASTNCIVLRITSAPSLLPSILHHPVLPFPHNHLVTMWSLRYRATHKTQSQLISIAHLISIYGTHPELRPKRRQWVRPWLCLFLSSEPPTGTAFPPRPRLHPRHRSPPRLHRQVLTLVLTNLQWCAHPAVPRPHPLMALGVALDSVCRGRWSCAKARGGSQSSG